MLALRRGGETIEGPWSFTFDLANQGGTGWRGSVSDTAAGVTITLERLVVTPTLIEGIVTWRGDPLRASEDDVWSATSTLEHGDERFRSDASGTAGNRSEFHVRRGTDDAAGAWTIRVERLTSDPGYPPRRVTIEGPWVFRIVVPADGDPALDPTF